MALRIIQVRSRFERGVELHGVPEFVNAVDQISNLVAVIVREDVSEVVERVFQTVDVLADVLPKP